MSYTYSTWVDQLSNMTVIGSTDANFLTMLPGAIDYAEGRIYRELDLLVTRITTTTTLSSGNRNVTLPTSAGTYRVVETVNVITPSTVTSSYGSRVPLVMTSRDFVDNIYPSGQTSTNTPEFVAMVSNAAMILGPSPDAAYQLEVVGTIQPTPLSSSNTTTFLTTMLPDLWMAATMVYASAYMRDFGAGTDDPKMSQSWENTYQTLIQSAGLENVRAKYQSGGWTSMQPSPVATPQRV